MHVSAVSWREVLFYVSTISKLSPRCGGNRQELCTQRDPSPGTTSKPRKGSIVFRGVGNSLVPIGRRWTEYCIAGHHRAASVGDGIERYRRNRRRDQNHESSASRHL